MSSQDENAPPLPLSNAQAVQLLEMLTTDTAYREQFIKDPAAALSQIGYDGPLEGIGWLDPVKLPGKQELEQALELLRQHDQGSKKMAMTVLFFLEANKTDPEDKKP